MHDQHPAPLCSHPSHPHLPHLSACTPAAPPPFLEASRRSCTVMRTRSTACRQSGGVQTVDVCGLKPNVGARGCTACGVPFTIRLSLRYPPPPQLL